MKNWIDIVEENQSEAVNMMIAHNVDKIAFINEEGEDLIEDIPYVLIADRHDMIFDAMVAEVTLGKDSNLYVLLNDEYCSEEVGLNDALSASGNNVAVAIEDYFKMIDDESGDEWFDTLLERIYCEIPENTSKSDALEIVRNNFMDVVKEMETDYPLLAQKNGDNGEVAWFDDYRDEVCDQWLDNLILERAYLQGHIRVVCIECNADSSRTV